MRLICTWWRGRLLIVGPAKTNSLARPATAEAELRPSAPRNAATQNYERGLLDEHEQLSTTTLASILFVRQ